MKATFSIVLALAAAALAAPSATADHCDYYEASALGVDAWWCADESGRVHQIFVKDESLGGASVTHAEAQDGDANHRQTAVLVYTYGRSPVGQTWVHPFYWCHDYDASGDCDFFWLGASSNVRGIFNQADVSNSGPIFGGDGSEDDGGPWRACTLLYVGWSCTTLPEPTWGVLAALPRLP